MMLALAIGIHNFPEGIATFVSSLNGLELAIPIVVAIAIHNIPEGVAVSMPIYHATGNSRKAFLMALLSGFAEPLGALFGLLVILPFWTPVLSSLLLSGVAGIMVYISIDELLPSAERYGYHHITIAGVILGMAIMLCHFCFSEPLPLKRMCLSLFNIGVAMDSGTNCQLADESGTIVPMVSICFMR